MKRLAPVVLLASLMLSGCELLGIESTEKLAATRDAEGRAIGAACRHAGRALEDCYALNRRSDKAAVFAGWREMNDYMRENKIDDVAPALSTHVAGAKSPEPAAEVDRKPADTAERPAGRERKQGS